MVAMKSNGPRERLLKHGIDINEYENTIKSEKRR